MSGTFKPSLGLPCLCLLLLLATALSAEECDKTKCKGPIRYYEDLKCKPIYEKDGDCCAVRYDCSHLSGRSPDKCHMNGHEYAIGEKLRDEDRTSPCDIGCICTEGYLNVAAFTCAAVDCFRVVSPGCYFKKAKDSCCGGEEVCPDGKEEAIKCEVDGQTYRDGESFYPNGTTDLSCQCQEGYKGENVEPFCTKIGCGTELRHSTELYQNCVPVFYSSQTPRTSCSFASRCQNDNDTVIHADQRSSEQKPDESEPKEQNEQMMCKYGNLTMHIGDELNQATDYSSVCVKCVCEVPPTPTCQRLPDEECDVTVHPQFPI